MQPDWAVGPEDVDRDLVNWLVKHRDDAATDALWGDALAGGKNSEIWRWTEEEGEDKRLRTVRIIIKTIWRRIRRKKENRESLEELATNWSNLEHLVRIGVAGFERKFYRDHLEHSLRVALLADFLAVETYWSPKERHHKRCALLKAALFHDVCYPLEKAEAIFNEASASLSSSYRLLDTGLPKWSLWSSVPFAEPASLAGLTGLDTETVYDQLAKRDHGAIAALELLKYGEKDPEVLRTVFCHSLSDHDVSLSQEPVLFFMVLSDELQEWGRSTGMSQAVDIDVGLKVGKRSIQAEITYGGQSEGISPIAGAFNKIRALKRLRWDDSIEFELKIVLPNDFVTISLGQASYSIKCAVDVIGDALKEELRDRPSDVPRLESLPKMTGDQYIHFSPKREEMLITSCSQVPEIVLTTDDKRFLRADWQIRELDEHSALYKNLLSYGWTSGKTVTYLRELHEKAHADPNWGWNFGPGGPSTDRDAWKRYARELGFTEKAIHTLDALSKLVKLLERWTAAPHWSLAPQYIFTAEKVCYPTGTATSHYVRLLPQCVETRLSEESGFLWR